MLRIALLVFAWLGISAASLSADLTIRVVNDAGIPVADAAVFMPDRGKGAAPARARATIVQRNRIFQPYVTVVQRGTAISFPNDDPFMHHVYSFSSAKRFEIKLYKGTPASPVVFDTSGLVVLGCNVHDWMIAYVLVVDTPVFEKTGKDGVVRFGNLPAGPHRWMLWAPGMREPAALPELTLADGESRSFEYRLKTAVKKQPPAPPFDPMRYSSLVHGRPRPAADVCIAPDS